jgi:chemotaxis protein CheX
MKMQLIQPFINAADAVLSEMLDCQAGIEDITMNEDTFRPRGVTACVHIAGEIEGRVIFDLDSDAALAAASHFCASETACAEMASEAVCELANVVIGNAVTALNGRGFRFRLSPPQIHDHPAGLAGSEETEAMVMCFSTPKGALYMNIAMRHAAVTEDAIAG